MKRLPRRKDVTSPVLKEELNRSFSNLKRLIDEGGGGGTATVDMQVTATHIQYRVNGGSWINLIALSELKGDPGDAGEPGITIEQMYNTAYSTHYTEFTKVDGKVTQINVWTNSGKTTKLFTKDISYVGGSADEITITDEINGVSLLTEIGRDIDGNITSVTKTLITP